MKVVVRIVDKEWRTAAWRRSGCDVKWGWLEDDGRGVVSCDPRVGVSTRGREVLEMAASFEATEES